MRRRSLRRRLVRAGVILVLALVVAFVIVDRLIESAAARAIAVQAHQQGLLAADPTVSIHGFPFLTQAAGGRYDEIDVTTHGIHRGGVRIDTVDARFVGVHAGLSAVLHGRLGGVRVDHATGYAVVTFTDLDALLAKRQRSIVAGASPGQVILRGKALVGGSTVDVETTTAVTLVDGVLTLTPKTATRDGGPLPSGIGRAVLAAFATTVPLDELPFGLVPTSVRTEADGIRVEGAARGPAVAVPADAAQQGLTG